MTDIVGLLRNRAMMQCATNNMDEKDHIDWEAADKIERLRKALAEIIKMDDDFLPETQDDYTNGWLVIAAEVARAALEGK